MVNEELPTADDWEAAKQQPLLQAAGGMEATISADLLQAVIDAARAVLPNEACGLLVGGAYAAAGGSPGRYLALTNAAASPYRYFIDPQEQLRVWLELEDADEVPWGIVHSHVASSAVPSATDVGLAYFPDSLYLVCSLADEMPTVRAWSIHDGALREVSLAVTP